MKRNNKRTKKIRNLVFVCVLTAILLTVSTYAWFIGMKTVNVSSFDVTIAAIDSLSLSLDGKTWADTVSISKATYNLGSNTVGNVSNCNCIWDIKKSDAHTLTISTASTTLPSGTKWVLEGR